LAYHTDYEGVTYSSLIKLDYNFDTLWKKDYTTDNLWTMTMKTLQTNDFGFLLTGSVKPAAGEYWNYLIIKTDSIGNMEWYQTYGGVWSEHGENTIQTPDGGYLIGGYFWKPGYDHSQDAMVIKTDSLGNEQWTQYYGNPDVDDDMALVAMADDGNYLVATVYGEEIISSMVRNGRLYLQKIDQGGSILWENKIGSIRRSLYIKNFRKVNNGFITTGFSNETDSVTYQYYSGWMMKLDNNLDSLWYHDYIHEDENWENFFYDASPTTDNGYIAIGKARPDGGGSTNKMWIVKVDSMGCDTPGCATGVQVFEMPYLFNNELTIWPNPASDWLNIEFSSVETAWKTGSAKLIRIYDAQGVKVKEITVPEDIDQHTVNVSGFNRGLYYLQYIHSNKIINTAKFIKH